MARDNKPPDMDGALIIDEDDEGGAERPREGSAEKLEPQEDGKAELAAEMVTEIVSRMGLQVEVKIREDHEEVVLDISGISDDKSVLSLSPGGRAREFLLVKRVSFSLRDNDGNVWLPLDTISVQRTYLYDDTERLAREIQEQRLLAEMQSDAIAQIVRRLQAARKA